MSTGGRHAIGFAFINFVDPVAAAQFEARRQSQRLSAFPKSRRMRMAAANMQGQSANVQALQRQSMGRLRSRLCRPVIIKGGRFVELLEY